MESTRKNKGRMVSMKKNIGNLMRRSRMMLTMNKTKHMKRRKGQSMPYFNPIIDSRSLDLEQPMTIMGPFSKNNLHEWFSTYVGLIPPTLSGVYFYAHN